MNDEGRGFGESGTPATAFETVQLVLPMVLEGSGVEDEAAAILARADVEFPTCSMVACLIAYQACFYWWAEDRLRSSRARLRECVSDAGDPSAAALVLVEVDRMLVDLGYEEDRPDETALLREVAARHPDWVGPHLKLYYEFAARGDDVGARRAIKEALGAARSARSKMVDSPSDAEAAYDAIIKGNSTSIGLLEEFRSRLDR